MATVEIDEVELQQHRNLKTLVERMLQDGRTKKQVTAAIKTINPKAELTDPEPEPWEAETKSLREQLAEEKKLREEAEAKRDQDAKIAAIAVKQEKGWDRLKSERWTEEGLKKVKELMDSEGILDPLIAASHIEKLNPPHSPIAPNSGSGPWNFMEPPAEEDVDLKKLIETKGDSMPLVDKMVRDALADVRGTPRR
jgi:hypothetical protein